MKEEKSLNPKEKVDLASLKSRRHFLSYHILFLDIESAWQKKKKKKKKKRTTPTDIHISQVIHFRIRHFNSCHFCVRCKRDDPSTATLSDLSSVKKKYSDPQRASRANGH